jgi:hypothetical protein
MVPLSKSGVRKHRGFESRPLRHNLANTHGPAAQTSADGVAELRLGDLGPMASRRSASDLGAFVLVARYSASSGEVA